MTRVFLSWHKIAQIRGARQQALSVVLKSHRTRCLRRCMQHIQLKTVRATHRALENRITELTDERDKLAEDANAALQHALSAKHRELEQERELADRRKRALQAELEGQAGAVTGLRAELDGAADRERALQRKQRRLALDVV